MEKNFCIDTNLNTPAITRFLGATVALCIFMAFFRGLVIYTTGIDAQNSILKIFNMDLEQTLPTYVSTINLLIASALLALVSKSKRSTKDKYWVHWSLLSLGFLFLSVDESISLHEYLVRTSVLNVLGISESHHMGAGIFIISCALIGGLFFLRFLLHLPQKTKLRFIVSGIVFVLGAAGMEALGGYILSDGYQNNKVAYNMGVIIEESMEMIGVLLFIRAVLFYIQENLLNASPLFHKAPAIPEATTRSKETSIAVPEEQLI